MASGAAFAIEARYCLDIVVVNIDRRPNHGFDTMAGTLEVRYQHFYPGGRSCLFDGECSRGEVRRATVVQVITVHRSYDHVLQAKPRNRLCNPVRFVGIQRTDMAMSDGAVWAVTCANVAHQHKGGSTMAETFTDIRTTSFLAHRVQLQFRQ